jgi:recombination protein RecT
VAGRVSERAAVEKAEPAKPTPKQVFTRLLEKNKGAIGLSLPRGMDQDRFVRLLLTATVTNPKLLECDPLSFLRAGVMSAQLGLEVGDIRGEAYIIPYGRTATFQPGYKGLMKLARRGGAAGFAAEAVYEGDDFDWMQGTEEWLHHKRKGNDDDATITHAWALAKMDGHPEFVVMFRAQVDKVMRESQAYKNAEKSNKRDSPWHTHYAEMAVKTAIIRLCGKLPMNAELAQAIAADHQAERGLVIEGVDLGDEDAIEASSAPAIEQAPADPPLSETVDRETGEVIEVTGMADDEPPVFGPDDEGRPF